MPSGESGLPLRHSVVSDYILRCLPLLREHHKRDQLLDLSLDAGDSARARGAHEVSRQISLHASSSLTCGSWRCNHTQMRYRC